MAVTHRLLLVIAGVVFAAGLLGVVLLWPGQVQVEEDPGLPAQTTTLVDATLVDVEEVSEEDTFGLLPDATLVEITARLDATGEQVIFDMTDETGDTYRSGQRVRLAVIESADQPVTYFIADFRRDRPMLLLAGLFVLAVVAFGRFQGVRALGGLVLTFAIIIGFIVPAILGGRSPLVVAIVGAALIMIVTLYLSHGMNPKTTAAVVGTAGALIITGLLAVAFVSAAAITGFTSEEARLANLEVGGLSLRGLLLAGIIIGGLGVLDDVTMSQSSTVFELSRANPAAGFAALVRGALNVGRDHIAATVNTLFLAYAGASLPLLILFVTGTDSIGTIVTAEIVAVEVVRTLVGSIGLIAAVPLTTALAAALATAHDVAGDIGGGHVHSRPPLAPTDPAPPAVDSPAPARPRAREKPQAADNTDEIPPLTGMSASPAVDEEDEDAWEQRLRQAYGLDKPRTHATRESRDAE